MTAATTATRQTATAAADREAGSVTLFFVVAALALFAMVGLVVDGGTKIRAAQQADSLAEEAARAGGQTIVVPPAVRGDPVVADPLGAAAAARRYLSANHITGTVRVADHGHAVDVAVSVTRPTVFLGMLGIASMTVHGQARARLVRGITAEETS
jgi:hypothetical protein